MNYRDRVEEGFRQLARLICRYRWIVIALNLLLALGLGAAAPRLTIDTSFESYLPEGNPKRTAFNEFRKQYGSNERLVITLRPAEVYDLEFLEKLRSLHRDLEDNLPYVDEVTSLVNARRTYGTETSLISEDLMEDWPDSEEDLALLRQRVESTKLYRNIVISEDGGAVIVVIDTDVTVGGGEESLSLEGEFGELSAEDETSEPIEYGKPMSSQQVAELIDAANAVLKKHEDPDVEMHMAGLPLFADALGEMITIDSTLFVILSFLIITVLLALLFRRVAGVLLPLLVVLFTVSSTLGAMAHIGMPLTAVTQILPSLLLAIGVGDAVHLLSVFFQRYNQGDSREDAIVYAMGHSGLAVLMTSLTTAASMASFNLTSLQPTIDLGRAAPFGVMMALLYSVILLPALLAVLPIRRLSAERQKSQSLERMDKILLGLGHFGSRHPWPVIGGTALLWLVAIAGASQLHFSHSGMAWFPEDAVVRVDMEAINEDLGGGNPFEFLIDSGRENGLHDPAFLAALEEMQSFAESTTVKSVYVGQSISIIDIVKETNQALHEGDKEFYRIPDDGNLISQEILLFENSGTDDLEDVTTSEHRTARMMVTVPFVDALYYPVFSVAVLDGFRSILMEHGLDEVTVDVTGMLTLAGETFDLLLVSMARSYTLAFTLIGILMILLIGSFRLGLLSVFPNVTPIIFALGLMGWFDVPLDISTMLLGSILIGIAVDDTIHFVHNYNRYYRQTGCSERAVELTLLSTGRAMFFTSIVLSMGFFVYMGATLSNIVAFGWLNGFGVLVAFLADVVLMPALVTLVASESK